MPSQGEEEELTDGFEPARDFVGGRLVEGHGSPTGSSSPHLRRPGETPHPIEMIMSAASVSNASTFGLQTSSIPGLQHREGMFRHR